MSAQRAMGWWCAGVVVFGLVLAGAAFAATDGPAWRLLERFGGTAVVPSAPLRFAVGLMGAVTIGWGASLWAMTSVSLADDERVLLWERVGWAVLAWFAIDSTISIATGFWPNAVSNTVLIGVFWAIKRRM